MFVPTLARSAEVHEGTPRNSNNNARRFKPNTSCNILVVTPVLRAEPTDRSIHIPTQAKAAAMHINIQTRISIMIPELVPWYAFDVVRPFAVERILRLR